MAEITSSCLTAARIDHMLAELWPFSRHHIFLFLSLCFFTPLPLFSIQFPWQQVLYGAASLKSSWANGQAPLHLVSIIVTYAEGLFVRQFDAQSHLIGGFPKVCGQWIMCDPAAEISTRSEQDVSVLAQPFISQMKDFFLRLFNYLFNSKNRVEKDPHFWQTHLVCEH